MSLITVTYAWIVIARFNYISGIDFNVTLGKGLEISYDGVNWGHSLDGSIINEMYPDILFSDITTQDGIHFEQGYSNEVPIKNKNYLSFDLFFRGGQEVNSLTAIHLIDHIANVSYVDAKNTNLSGTYITSKGVEFKSDITFLNDFNDTIEKGETRKFHASEALRVSIYNKEDDQAKIFDLSNNPFRGFATTINQYGALDYYKRHHPNKIIEIPDEPLLSGFSEIINEHYANNQNSRIATLVKSRNDAYYYAQITINIWIEGWDLDAFNAIMGDEFIINFKFVALVDSTI